MLEHSTCETMHLDWQPWLLAKKSRLVQPQSSAAAAGKSGGAQAAAAGDGKSSPPEHKQFTCRSPATIGTGHRKSWGSSKGQAAALARPEVAPRGPLGPCSLGRPLNVRRELQDLVQPLAIAATANSPRSRDHEIHVADPV